MPLQKLKFAPTMVANNTEYSAEGSWRMGDKVRFRNGYPETIGGWMKQSVQTFLGTCRALTSWRTLAGENLLGVGTHLKYYVERGGGYYDITPIRKSSTLVDPITTIAGELALPISSATNTLELVDASVFPSTGYVLIDSEEILYSNKAGNVLLGLTRGRNGSTPAAHLAGASVYCRSVKVDDVAHGAITDDYFEITTTDPVDGLSAAQLTGEFRAFVENNEFDYFYFDTGVYATSTVTGGGSVSIDYQVNSGLETFVQGVGWGAGGWGQSPWGQAANVGIGQQLRLWNHQNFGEDLLYGPRGGGLYYWDSSTGFAPVATRGTALTLFPDASDVPVVHNKFLITESRFTIVFGTNPIGSFDLDPLLIRWSDQELLQVWTPLPTNLAGDLRLSLGTEIIAAVQTRQEILVWTDSALYSLQFSPEVGFTQSLIADNISISGPNAVIVANNQVFWMGADKFYTYTGRSETLPSTVNQYVFEDYNSDQGFQVYAGVNEGFDEVWFFYPSSSSLENDRYVIYNYVDNGWAVGNLSRTAWLDSGIRPNPIAAAGNILYAHEFGNDDYSTDPPSPLRAYIESGDFGVGDGDSYAFVHRMVPDVTFSRSLGSTPSAVMTLQPRVASGAIYRAEGATPAVTRSATVPVEQYTEQVWVRLRGRQMKLRVESSTLGTAWRLGTPRLDIKPDGRRA